MRVAQFQTVDPFTSTRAENLALALGGGNDHPVTPLTRTFFPVVPFSVSYVCDIYAIIGSVKKYRALVPMVLFRVTGQTHGYDLGARQRAVTVSGLRQTVFYDVIQAIYLVPEDMRFRAEDISVAEIRTPQCPMFGTIRRESSALCRGAMPPTRA